MKKNTSFKAIYIRGPTVILEIGGLRIMTDPALGPAGSAYHSGLLLHEKIKSPAAIEIGQIDMVLLSHDRHFDNLDHAGGLLLQKVPKTSTTISVAGRLNGTTGGLKSWQSDMVIAPDATELVVTATLARHRPV